jgi:CheY-like chemotaxis protein
MKLKDIRPSDLKKAVAIYLRHAYPEGGIPARVEPLLDWSERGVAGEWMQDPRVEFDSSCGANRFFLRLGNAQYPHMKLGIVELTGKVGEYVFQADTHDRHFSVPESSPGYERFLKVQEWNAQVKLKVEQEWRLAGLATEASIFPVEAHAPSQRESVYTILAVDDTDYMLLLVEKLLQNAGYRVIACSGGKKAIEQARKHRIDLGLFDVMMPEMDGYALIDALKEAGLKRFPVLLATAAPESQVRKEKAEGYVAKPFAPQYLLRSIEKLLEVHEPFFKGGS